MCKIMILLILSSLILTCPDEPNCNACTSDSKGKCDFCYRGFLDKDDKCTVAPRQDKIDNCVQYQPKSDFSKTTACKICEYGYFVDGSVCKKCTISGCAVCTKEGDCSACFKGKKLVQADKADTVKCSDLESDVPNCDICQYNFPKTDFKCLKCKASFAVSEKAAVKESCKAAKVKNCLVLADDSDEKCKFCDLGYYIDREGKCQSNDVAHWYEKWWFWVGLAVAVGLVVGGGVLFMRKKEGRDSKLKEYLGN